MNSSHASGIKNNKIEHRVKTICYSHLKGYAVRINQYLSTKFEVSGFIESGAHTNHLVYSQELELKSIGKKDVIVINGGSNDIDNNSAKRIGLLNMITWFIQKYKNTYLMVVNIPLTRDLAMDSKISLAIQAFNAKLNKVIKPFRHPELVEMDPNREYFTEHGLYLNNAGKQRLAKLIATQIKKLIGNRERTEHIIAMNWKEKILNKDINGADNLMHTSLTMEYDLQRVLLPPIQVNSSQGNMIGSEFVRRTSDKQKKSSYY